MKSVLLLSISLFLLLCSSGLAGRRGLDPRADRDPRPVEVLASAPLSGGTYTIGGADGTFATFSAAAAKLNADGVAGPVFFDVRPGTYAEGVTLRRIPGASAINTVTFRAENGDSSSVLLSSPTDTSNFTLRMIASAHVIFRNLSIRTADTLRARTVLLDHCANIRFEGTVIQGVTMGSRTTLILLDAIEPDSGITVTGSLLRVGGTAIRMASDSIKRPGVSITGNRFEALRDGAAFLTAMAAPLLADNTIDINSSAETFTGLDIYLCSGAIRIERNRITIRAHDGVALSLWGCDGTGAAPATVANNMIGFEVDEVTSQKQWGILCYDSHYCSFLFNSVNLKFFVSNPLGNTIGFSLQGNAPNHITVLDNIFATNSGHAIAMATQTDSTLLCDYNDLYSTSGAIGLYGGDEAVTLANWRGIARYDLHSLSVPPGFASTFDLHRNTIALKAAGLRLPGGDTDIDGDRRNPIRPDIGADEKRDYREFPAYTPFPGDRADWRIQICGLVCDTSRIWVRGDTTINGLIYHKVYQTVDTLKFPLEGAVYMGALREDSLRQIFILRPGFTHDLLLYDFDAEAGDTLMVNSWTDTTLHPVVVSSVDSVQLHGVYRRRINLAPEPGESWIDGIGSTRHVLFPKGDVVVTEFEPTLFCYRLNGLEMYGDRCEDISAGVDDQVSPGLAWRVTASRTSIDLLLPGDRGYTLELFDMSGRSVARITGSASGRVAFDRPLAAGAYIYRLKLESGSIVDGKVMVQ